MKKNVRNFDEWKNSAKVPKKGCSCGSWLHHWSLYSGIEAPVCGQVACSRLATDGGLMTEVASPDEFYVIPLCHEHHSHLGQVISLRKTVAVRAVKGPHC